MKRIAKFEKVSFEQFEKDFKDCYPESKADIKEVYEAIQLPKRATKGSAGYDYFAPIDIVLKPGETTKIPTGIRCHMEEGWVLMNYPRSGLGFKFRLQLNNTVGIIDSDYYGAKNEGHIMSRITNDSNEGKTVEIKAGTGFIQGIFMEFGICEDDEADALRDGGFGSTTK
ncbi:MAG: deoxyuridine 5'-triphosphate nucleotidohydrolase [Erysipelotrichaceae bacterium]|nr:deoxyuridine 5'-triphosphate nucleotidohydrolase [Erysipelotrichaceae bacterium]